MIDLLFDPIDGMILAGRHMDKYNFSSGGYIGSGPTILHPKYSKMYLIALASFIHEEVIDVT